MVRNGPRPERPQITGEPIIAVGSGHLFQKVHFPPDVVAPEPRDVEDHGLVRPVSVDLEPQGSEEVADFLLGEGDAQRVSTREGRRGT